jgi:hypothetical protein
VTRGRKTFNEEQVLEIVSLRRRMSPVKIARRFQTDPALVRRILTGKTYRDITHRESGGPCQCPACVTTRLGEENIDYIRATRVTRPCMFCHGDATVTVAKGLAAHGLFACADCDGSMK